MLVISNITVILLLEWPSYCLFYIINLFKSRQRLVMVGLHYLQTKAQGLKRTHFLYSSSLALLHVLCSLPCILCFIHNELPKFSRSFHDSIYNFSFSVGQIFQNLAQVHHLCSAFLNFSKAVLMTSGLLKLCTNFPDKGSRRTPYLGASGLHSNCDSASF